MAAPYEKERFKKHVTSCSYSTGGGRMKSLENFGIVALSASTRSSSASSSRQHLLLLQVLVCFHAQALRIRTVHLSGQYFSRTCVASAGGEDLHLVARSLFSDEFKNLSSEKKELVRLKQKHTHTWSVDHLMKTIHAIGKAPCEVMLK
jgi:hypothetical protein